MTLSKKGVVLSFFVFLFVISCAVPQPRPEIPVVIVGSTGELFERTKNTNPIYDSLRATAKVSVSSPDEKYKIDEVILAKQPGYLRLESIGPMGETLLFLATDQKKVYIYSPMENRYYHGLASIKNLSLIIPLPFKTADIVELLQGRIDLSNYYPSEMSFDQFKEIYTLTLMPDVKGRGRGYLTLDARTLYILDMKLYDEDNNLIVAGEFSDFEDLGGKIIPKTIEYRVPKDLTFITIKIEMNDIKLGTYVEDSRFVIEPPRGVQDIDLDKSIINFNRTPIK